MAKKLKRFSIRKTKGILKTKKLTINNLAGLMMSYAPDGMKPSPQYVSNVLNGTTKTPGINAILLMAFALNVEISDLLEEAKWMTRK